MNDKVLSIIIKAQDQASRVLDEVGSKTEAMAAKIGAAALRVTKFMGVAFVGAVGAAAAASLHQVSAVQQATVALSAYEKSGDKVQGVLKGLLAYARSDMGVLFNRTDLFESAQSLKIMGDNTEQLTEHVKILSRSVGLGLSNWDELNLIVGRVGSTGRLTGDDFDNLTKAGYRLDPALRNTNITFDKLFKALDKGIPVDALSGQANTIRGLSIRFQTAFRGIGNAILGVDSDTNQFIKGGIGDRLTDVFKKLIDTMKSEPVKNFFKTLGDGAINVSSIVIASYDAMLPHVKTAIDNLVTFGDRAESYVVPRAMHLYDSMMGFLVPAVEKLIERFKQLNPLIQLAISPVVALAVNMGDLQRFAFDLWQTLSHLWDVFSNSTPVIILVQFFQQVFVPALAAIWAAISQNLLPALGQLWDSLVRLWNAVNPGLTDALKILAAIFGAELLAVIYISLAAWNLIIQALSILISVIANVINWVSNLISWFGNLIGIVINTVGVIITIFRNLIPAVRDVVLIIASIFGGIGSAILNSIGNFGSLLYNKGRDLISGLVRGIQDEFGKIGSSISDGIGNVLHKAHIPGFASGTNFAPGGMALVGERGPELVNLPRGSQVIPNNQTQGMLAGSATFNMYGSINLGSSDAVDRFFDRLNAQKELGHYGVGV